MRTVEVLLVLFESRSFPSVEKRRISSDDW